MKTLKLIIYTCSIILIAAISSHAQHTLQTAQRLKLCSLGGTCYTPVTSYQFLPTSTSLPVGPYYGSLQIQKNPMWFYVATCMDMSWLALNIDYTNGLVSSSDTTTSLSIWGPYDDWNLITLDSLDAGRLILSVPAVAYNQYSSMATGGSISFSQSKNNIYVLMISSADTLLTSTISSQTFGLLAFPVQSADNKYEDCYLCNGKPTYSEFQLGLCMLTVDGSINKNKLIWEKHPTNVGLGGYVIGRENFVPNQYDSIDFVPYNSISEYVDLTSSPLTKQHKYKIIPIDSCNNPYPLYFDPYYSPIFLQSSPGSNNVVNLNWDYSSYYNYKNFHPVHYIWRSSNGGSYQLIDSLPVSGSSTSLYTDITAPAGSATYYIEQVKTIPCSPSLLPTASMRSNPSVMTVTGIQNQHLESNVKIAPNPFSDYTDIVSTFIIQDKTQLSLKTIDGKIVLTEVASTNNTHRLNKGNLENGVYILEIGDKEIIRKKLVMMD